MKFTYSQIKEYINSFPKSINYRDYHTNILLNDGHKWTFVNPNHCKPSIKNYIGAHIRFFLLKKLLKNGYKLTYLKCIKKYQLIKRI